MPPPPNPRLTNKKPYPHLWARAWNHGSPDWHNHRQTHEHRHGESHLSRSSLAPLFVVNYRVPKLCGLCGSVQR
ncbi:hypothetical protein PRUPE_8G037500 [Prunus persica]|uniref:Uncharacterized protein n=1 Tax=Prunus persica TaxID=3760 RepID=A0A251MSG6_PRUPE|nr:hypothetical protein PRUPE_8G037500 [Prunus persica]